MRRVCTVIIAALLRTDGRRNQPTAVSEMFRNCRRVLAGTLYTRGQRRRVIIAPMMFRCRCFVEGGRDRRRMASPEATSSLLLEC